MTSIIFMQTPLFITVERQGFEFVQAAFNGILW